MIRPPINHQSLAKTRFTSHLCIVPFPSLGRLLTFAFHVLFCTLVEYHCCALERSCLMEERFSASKLDGIIL